MPELNFGFLGREFGKKELRCRRQQRRVVGVRRDEQADVLEPLASLRHGRRAKAVLPQ